MEAAWGFLGATVGAFVTQVFNVWLDGRRVRAQEAERERDRAHERDLRRLDLDEAHRARLYGDRKVAYAEFYRTYHQYQGALEVAANARGGPIKGEDPESAVERYFEALEKLFEARLAMDERLRLVELAASPGVRTAAAELRARAENAERRELFSQWKGLTEDRFHESVAEMESLWDAVNEGERLLREAIQVELELGR